VAALLWFTMLSSIALQLGGAEPGVESTYWWMDESKMSQVPKPLKKGQVRRVKRSLLGLYYPQLGICVSQAS